MSPSRSSVPVHRRPLLSLATGALGLLLVLQISPVFAQGAGDTVDVIEVEVPIQVLVGGEPIRGLTRDDFTLKAAGKRREILGFREVDLRESDDGWEGEDEGTPVPLAARRHILLLFDLSFASPARIDRARDAARRLLVDGFLSSDLISVATFSVDRGVNVMLGFTPDHQQAESAVASLGLAQLQEAAADPLGLTFFDRGNQLLIVGDPNSRGLEGVDLTTAESLIAEAGLSAAYTSLSDALTELAQSLQPVAGRKHVIYLSEGSSSALLLGIGRGDTSAERQQIERMNEASIQGNVAAVNSNARFGSTHALVEFEEMLQEFVRSGATIQSIDIGGLRAEHDGKSSGDDTLFMMANKTGGEYIRNHNDLDLAVEKMLTRTAVSYLLTFEAPVSRRNDQFERIKVQLNRKIKGARIHHRPGYHSPVPYADLSPRARRALAAQTILADEERRELEVAVKAHPSFDARDRGAVSVILEADARSLLAAAPGSGPAQVEIYGYVLAGGGLIAGSFDEVLSFAADRTRPLSFRADLALEPGSYELRLLVRESTGGATSTRVVEFEVPAGARS